MLPVIQHINSVYMVGIGGIGMSALARYFHQKGSRVKGYDKTPSPLTEKLQAEGIVVHHSENEEEIPTDVDLYVYTPAIAAGTPLLNAIKSRNAALWKRAEVLAAITATMPCIAVGGTHGKTTTSALVAHVLHQSGLPISAFVGGIMTDYRSNVILDEQPKWCVVEADEFDRSFLKLSPNISVITSVDPDHLDVYGSAETMRENFIAFAGRTSAEGQLIEHEDCNLSTTTKMTYGQSERADVRLLSYGANQGVFQFTFSMHGAPYTASMKLPGRHNALNAIACVAVCTKVGISVGQCIEALASFSGIYRRFEIHIESNACTYIDDYAHHPAEIEAAIAAARMMHPEKKLTVIFQPHLYSRTRDLEAGFAESLSKADEVILLDIYPAREEPIDGVSSANLLKKIELKTKQLAQKSDLINAVLSLSPEMVMTLGAGDIDRMVKPLKEALLTKTHA